MKTAQEYASPAVTAMASGTSVPPRRPSSLKPQQVITPVVRTAHVWMFPAAIAAIVDDAAVTKVGTMRRYESESPSCLL